MIPVQTQRSVETSPAVASASFGISQAVRVNPLFFEGREAELSDRARRWSDEFTFGDALTVHKSQGSQGDSVVLFDESAAFREDGARWLYTGITRAARELTLVLPTGGAGLGGAGLGGR
jgi:superfamily I DNA/RNA helicase